VADVSEFATDPGNAPLWYVNIKSVAWKTPPPVQVGSQIDFCAQFLGRRLAYRYEAIARIVSETMSLMTLLEHFKHSHLPIALVVDEFGGVEGLVSLTDVVGSIGRRTATGVGEEPSIVRREDGSSLLDGALDLDTVLRTLDRGIAPQRRRSTALSHARRAGDARLGPRSTNGRRVRARRLPI
jgi:hypothetical protein